MRTIVPFVLALALYAQPPLTPTQQIDRLEKRVADGHSITSERIALVRLYFTQRNIEGRRRHVLWLIENHPETVELMSPPFALDRYAQLPDSVGFEEAARHWREQSAKPDASIKAIGNAVRFFRFADTTQARSLLEAGLRAHPNDPSLLGWRGVFDAMAMGGEVMTAPGVFAGDHTIQRLPEAARARKEIESSSSPSIIGSAGEELVDRYFVFAEAPALSGDDPLDLAEKWLLRARELEPESAEWKRGLSRVYERQGLLTADPKWRVEVYRKADTLDPDWNALPSLPMAEFEAGDDQAAARDARRLLDRVNASPNFVNLGHVILGRVALARGDVAQAKADLMASLPPIPPTFSFEPNRTLAQDLVDFGERDIVVQFFERSREYWKNDQGAIDHYIRMVKAPGTHDIATRFFPGQDVRGRPAPKLPIDDYTGKAVAVQFRNAACKECAKEFEALNRAVSSRGVVDTWIDFQGNESLVNQYQIETFPTVVLIDTQGRVADFIPGHLDERVMDQRLEQLALRGPRQLPAPKPRADAMPGVLAWSPVPGAESYVVQWDQRDEKGWLSDRDDHLVRVIPTQESSVTLDPALGETNPGTIRWRVFAVSRAGAGSMSEWREMSAVRP
jgi:hypothetical protein